MIRSSKKGSLFWNTLIRGNFEKNKNIMLKYCSSLFRSSCIRLYSGCWCVVHHDTNGLELIARWYLYRIAQKSLGSKIMTLSARFSALIFVNVRCHLDRPSSPPRPKVSGSQGFRWLRGRPSPRLKSDPTLFSLDFLPEKYFFWTVLKSRYTNETFRHPRQGRTRFIRGGSSRSPIRFTARFSRKSPN